MNSKSLLWFSAVLLAAFAPGCGKGSSSAPNETNTTSSGNPITAPADYLGAVGQAQKRAGKVVSAVGIDQAIKMYQTAEGTLPPNLNALVPDYLNSIPPAPNGMKYNYDPKTGIIKVEPK